MYYVSFLFLSLSQLHYRWSKTNRGTLTDASVGFGVPYPHQEKDSTLRCWKQYKSALNHGILRRLFQRKKSIEVALVEPILNNSIFLKLCFGINLRLLCADFTGACQQLVSVKLQKSIQPFRPILHAHRNFAFSPKLSTVQIERYDPLQI